MLLRLQIARPQLAQGAHAAVLYITKQRFLEGGLADTCIYTNVVRGADLGAGTRRVETASGSPYAKDVNVPSISLKLLPILGVPSLPSFRDLVPILLGLSCAMTAR